VKGLLCHLFTKPKPENRLANFGFMVPSVGKEEKSLVAHLYLDV
jgi:hypothetical protein